MSFGSYIKNFIRGGTDGTKIGNTGDALHIDNQTPGAFNITDTNNSTTTPLAANGDFTGTAVFCQAFTSITVIVYSDVDSATDGLQLQFSPDGTNWDETLDFTLDASANSTRRFTLAVEAEYFRIVYTNGTSAQTEFRLQTILHNQYPGPPTIRVSDELTPDRSASVVKSVISARSDSGPYTNIGSTDEGRLKVDIEADDTNPLPVNLPLVTDMTSRLKTAKTNRVFSATWELSKQPRDWTERITGSGTVSTGGAREPSYLRVQVPVTSGEKVELETKRFIKYQPFRTHTATFAEILGAGDPNCRQRFGQFTELDGWFFERQGNDFYAAVVNSVGVTAPTIPTPTKFSIANWNVDKFDGTGPSGLDFTSNGDLSGSDGDLKKAITYLLEFVWHGTQGVKFGIQYFDQVYWGHFYKFSGTESKPFSKTALLPIRYELENVGTLTNAIDDWYIGPNSFNIEDGEEELGVRYSASRGTTAATVNSGVTPTNLLAIRPKATFNGVTTRGYLIPINYQLLTSADILYEIVVQADITTATWQSAGADSIAEYSTDITAVSGGFVIQSGYIAGGGNSGGTVAVSFEERLFSSLERLNSDTPLCVLVRAYRTGSNASAYAAIDWREIY